MSSICLNMIVKNEAAIITRCLDSVNGFISTLYVLDTGSTDNTIQIINDWCKQNHIEGIVAQSTFNNFEQARNEALTGALNSTLNFSHLLFLDAGMEVIFDGGAPQQDLNYQPGFHYTIDQKLGNIIYANSRIVCRFLPMQWKGVCHEYLECPQPALKLHGLHILCHQDGGNQVGQIERYRDLLLDGIKQDPTNSRYAFYLAQSHYDLGEFADAYHWYATRINMGGWDEEVWYSRLRLAMSAEHLPFTESDIIWLYTNAYLSRPQRVEPLHYLARHLGQGDVMVGVFPKPKDILFVEWGLYRGV